jgi:hypothetical protein
VESWQFQPDGLADRYRLTAWNARVDAFWRGIQAPA